MKVLVLLMICTIAAAYTDVDDGLNVEDLIKDVPTLRGNLNCYLDRGPCSEQNLGYKKHFMEVVQDGCRECNDRERHMFRVFIYALKKNLPTEYQEFKSKYDPDGRHFEPAVAAVERF